MIFYDKEFNPAYQIKPFGMGKLTFMSEADDDFIGWEEYKGVPPGLIDLETPMADADKMVQVKRAEDVKVSEKQAKKLVQAHKQATAVKQKKK